MNTLFAKLSVTLLAVVVLTGIAFFIVDRVNSRLYHEELTQRLNAPIAGYATERHRLISDGVPDLAALEELAHQAMLINPTIEIYLLNRDGAILGHALPPTTVLRDAVDLFPVRAMIGGAATLPIHGDDPRSMQMTKVFSAAEIRHAGQLEGYLYVVLGGQKYENLATDLSGSYVGNVSLVAALAIVVSAAAIGLLVTGFLTRRLKKLNLDVERVTASHFTQQPISEPRAGGDEIDRLVNAFFGMASQIRRQIAQLEDNDRLRRELVSNISHDLRTPLSATQGYLETLLIRGESLSSNERRHYLTVARRHLMRLGNLITDLFELSKLDSAGISPNLEEFPLAELVQDVAQEFQLEAENKGVKLLMALGTGGAVTVGDIGLIQRALENLVRNAVHFTPAGGTVTLSIVESPQSLNVAVSDTGPGIPERDLPRIFDRFYRSESGEEARADSSGLGLAIAKRILDLHNSQITVTSRVDAGTRFEFQLPLTQRVA